LLVEERVESGRLRSNRAECLSRTGPDEPHDHRDDRKRRERDERHPEVEDEHHDDDARERDQIAERIDHARREELTHGIDVVRRSGHEPADRRPVVVAKLETLHEVEEPRA